MTDEQFSFWLAGLCDGEAHFSFTLARSTSGRLSASPRFCIALTEKDSGVLEMAQARTGLGKLRKMSRQRERDNGRASLDAVAWEVTGPSCAALAQLLQGKLQSKKAREFELWGPAVIASAAMPRYDTRRAPLLIHCRNQLLDLRNSSAARTPEREFNAAV